MPLVKVFDKGMKADVIINTDRISYIRRFSESRPDDFLVSVGVEGSLINITIDYSDVDRITNAVPGSDT